MAKPLCTDAEFVALFERLGATKMADELGMAERHVYTRRRRIEQKLGRTLIPPTIQDERRMGAYPMRVHREIREGIVLVGSDAHYWPGDPTPAHRGFCALAAKLKPAIIILNGDVLDGARISRHPAIGWTKTPTLKEELAACEERLEEIRKAAPQAELWWTMGNHCIRFESKLSNEAGEYEGIKGTRLADHFPHWKHAVSIWLNEKVVIKHRIKGGIHATHNNTLWAGKTTVTGHLHSLKVTPFSDYNPGIRYGVDTGTLSDPYGEHANYAEDNPLNHRSGFVVLTFRDGELLWPEIAAVHDAKRIQFRGELLEV